MKYTPANISKLEPNQIFVFGSNFRGAHGKGAALTAVRKFGARNGQGQGLQGQSYGVCTKDHNIKTLPLHKIGMQIDKLIRFAIHHPEFEFLVTEVGCGLAGYSPKDIAPMFGTGIPANIILPESFWKVILNA